MARGMFIALEGIDGTGTTTQARLLVRRLRSLGVPSALTREPSKGAVGRLIDRMISIGKGKGEAKHGKNFYSTIALLFAADRLDHIKSEIEPAQKAGKCVVSDRYLMSSLAYQPVKLSEEWVREINSQSPMADLTILLDASPNVCLERISKRTGREQIFERKSYLRAVRSNYLRQAREYITEGYNVVILDGSKEIAVVKELIWQHVEALLQECTRKTSVRPRRKQR